MKLLLLKVWPSVDPHEFLLRAEGSPQARTALEAQLARTRVVRVHLEVVARRGKCAYCRRPGAPFDLENDGFACSAGKGCTVKRAAAPPAAPELPPEDEALLREGGWYPSPVRDGWWRDADASGEDYPLVRALRIARREKGTTT